MKLVILLFLLLTVIVNADIGTLKKVVDGDTLHFTNDKCRILYIDTPSHTEIKKLNEM